MMLGVSTGCFALNSFEKMSRSCGYVIHYPCLCYLSKIIILVTKCSHKTKITLN